jgi:hypothetical protein
MGWPWDDKSQMGGDPQHDSSLYGNVGVCPAHRPLYDGPRYGGNSGTLLHVYSPPQRLCALVGPLRVLVCCVV